MCVLFFCNQISAQDCSSDSISAVKNQKVSDEKLQPFIFHLFVMLVEPNYDYISDYVYPNSVIAVKERNHYIVDIRTGEEHLIKDPEETEKVVSAKAKEKDNDDDDEDDWEDDEWYSRE